MRLKSGYMLRQIAGEWAVIPIGQRVSDFNGLITLSETASVLWRLLEDGCSRDDMIDALCEQYSADRATVSSDVDEFIKALTEGDVLILD